mgnify:CR=1 FL=1
MSGAVQKQLTAAGFAEPSFSPASLSAMTPPVQQQQQEAQSSVMKAGIDLTAGTVAGVAQLIVGHPFDTIKVSGVLGLLYSRAARITNPSCAGPRVVPGKYAAGTQYLS